MVYSVIVNAGYVAFLMILLGGLPIIFVAIKQAFVARRSDVLALFGVAALMVIVFTVVVILVLTGHWGFDPNGGIFALVFFAFLLVVTVAVARAVLRSELSERVLRFALVPYIVVTAAMGVALLATFVEAWLLSMYTPEAFAGTVTPDWVIADLMMVVAMGVAGWALWRGLRARGGRVVAA
jgi:CheY-like chemotaxis protein